jgi:hypothetical protein
MKTVKSLQNRSQLLIYQSEDGRTRIEVQLQDETVWLSQKLMADLFQTSKQNIGQHLKNIFEEGELREYAVVKKFFTTAADGKKYQTRFYNLDAIISVGYRVKSHVATRFRQWATRHIREFIVKGFVLDDERLKNPDLPFDYFEELLRLRIRVGSINHELLSGTQAFRLKDFKGISKHFRLSPIGK